MAEYDSFQVEFAEGLAVKTAAFLASFPSEQTSDVGQKMGVRLDGGRLAANGAAGLATNVEGVYAIGDANADNVTNVPHALFSGKRTAVFLHGKYFFSPVRLVGLILGGRANNDTVKLAREDAEKEINGTIARRDMELEARSLWDTVNGQPGDILYAGAFDGN